MFIDGSSTREGSGVRIVLKSPEEIIIEQAIRIGFAASNNEAEYKALIMSLKKARMIGVQNLNIH